LQVRSSLQMSPFLDRMITYESSTFLCKIYNIKYVHVSSLLIHYSNTTIKQYL
jgi:hypothetical protein